MKQHYRLTPASEILAGKRVFIALYGRPVYVRSVLRFKNHITLRFWKASLKTEPDTKFWVEVD